MHHRFGLCYAPLLGFVVAINVSVCFAVDPSPFTEEQRQHWAYRDVSRPVIPQASSGVQSAQNPVDQFILASLQRDGLSLSVPADRTTLLRRITFDLIGLPPTPEDAADFVADESPDAYERVVDRLLCSPHYGEAWGRNWLDVVRFAETAGFKEDPLRPTAYTYRDYVIRAFNRDLPFDRFVADQIAGDELFPNDAESLAATGYCRMWPDESNASNILLARQTSLDDLTGNVGAAFLGMSVACAQCHNHKFDPILQSDFYQLQAFFSGIVLEDQVPIGTAEELAEYRRAEQAWLAETSALRQELNQLERPARVKMQGERRMKFPTEVLDALDTPIEDRTTMQRQLAFWSARQMGVKEEDIPKLIDEAARVRREEVLAQLAEAKQRRPNPNQQASVMAVGELCSSPPATHRMENGSYDQPRELVEPHFPTILRRASTSETPAIIATSDRSSGRRAVLARWLASPDNPVTHRVWANRLWQGHFGQGLVSNANDFGTQTAAPTHARLLDWLTSELISREFGSKSLHRQIVLSATYRQQTRFKDDLGDDGADTMSMTRLDYSHYPRQRLSSERIRDAWLIASGQFNDSMYGPGIRPELPPNFSSYDWKVSEPPQQVRRSVYIFAKRNLPYPLMVAFDFPDMHEACGCRTKTTIAPQALMLLNNRVIIQAAKDLASRSKIESTSADPAAQIQRAWQISFGRNANDREIEVALKFIADQAQLITSTVLPEAPQVATRPTPGVEAFADWCHALLNANEFLFLE